MWKLASSGTLQRMDDQSILRHIEALVNEEHALQGREGADAVDSETLEADRGRLNDVSIELDRCWDLLRQRRARRAAGQNPEDAEARGPATVEKYLQ